MTEPVSGLFALLLVTLAERGDDNLHQAEAAPYALTHTLESCFDARDHLLAFQFDAFDGFMPEGTSALCIFVPGSLEGATLPEIDLNSVEGV